MLRIGIAGCGLAARTHLARLLAIDGVRVVGCADPDPAAARALADLVPAGPDGPSPTFADHKELLGAVTPDALAIFTPHRRHYRIAMDALQAGCHVFIERPLSIDVQEAADVIGLARGRKRKVGVGHQYRLRPSLVEARRRVLDGAIGPLRLVQATLAAPWLAAHGGAEDAWRFDAKATGGGILFDAGDHLVDALLWTTGRSAVEVAAIQVRHDSGADVVTAAALRLADGTPATLGISGVSPGTIFALTYFGERGRLRATADSLIEEPAAGPGVEVALPARAEDIDGNFVAAVTGDAPLCCPADQALETVRLLEAIGRAGASGQVVRLA